MINCPHCRGSLTETPELSGQTVSCPMCDGQFVMPGIPTAPIPVLATHIHHQAEIKNSGMSAVLSFLWPGIGQIYNGQIGKGIAMALVQSVFLIMCAFLIGIPLFLIMWVWGIYDAYQQAEAINRRPARRRR